MVGGGKRGISSNATSHSSSSSSVLAAVRSLPCSRCVLRDESQEPSSPMGTEKASIGPHDHSNTGAPAARTTERQLDPRERLFF